MESASTLTNSLSQTCRRAGVCLLPRLVGSLKITPACKGQKTWQSCDVTGTVKGKPITGVAAAELAQDVLQEFRELLFPKQERKGDATKVPAKAGRE